MNSCFLFFLLSATATCLICCCGADGDTLTTVSGDRGEGLNQPAKHVLPAALILPRPRTVRRPVPEDASSRPLPPQYQVSKPQPAAKTSSGIPIQARIQILVRKAKIVKTLEIFIKCAILTFTSVSKICKGSRRVACYTPKKVFPSFKPIRKVKSVPSVEKFISFQPRPCSCRPSVMGIHSLWCECLWRRQAFQARKSLLSFTPLFCCPPLKLSTIQPTPPHPQDTHPSTGTKEGTLEATKGNEY